MLYMALWLVVFLTNGDPIPFTMIVPPEQTCGRELALSIAKDMQMTIGAVQDLVLWKCEEVTSPGVAPPLEHPEFQPAFKRDADQTKKV